MNITLEWLNNQKLESLGNAREVRLNCPNCDDINKHLYVNTEKSLWYCFKCGKGGKVHTNQGNKPDLTVYSSDEIIQRIKEGTLKSGDIVWTKVTTAPTKSSPIKSIPLHRILPHIEIPEDYVTSEELNAREYLYSRGVTQEEITNYGISLSIEKSGPYKNSIIFPVFNNTESQIDYFVCRKYDNSKPKYVNAPWPKGDTLFTAYANKGGPNYPWVLCEGIFDALAIRRVGYNAIALLGKVPTSQQLKRIADREQYLIYLDDDAFSQAVNLKLQLSAVGTKAKLIIHSTDAAQLYVSDTPLLRTLLDGATKQLNENKKS